MGRKGRERYRETGKEEQRSEGKKSVSFLTATPRKGTPQETESHLETGRLQKPKRMIENSTVPGKIETGRGEPLGKRCRVQRMGFPGAGDEEGVC